MIARQALLLILFVLTLSSLCFGGIAVQAQETKPMDAPLRTISISATGTVTAAPDMASINTGVATEADTAKAAVTANSAAMRKIMESLTAAGLEARDIQTSDFSVQPKYQYFQDNTPPKLVGYQVSNQVHIRVRDVAKLGDVLDKVVDAGSNQISGIEFAVSKADELADQARANAYGNALRKAELYARAAGATLGPVLSMAEGSVSPPRPVMVRKAMAAEASDAVPVAAGEQSLDVSLNVVWLLK
jgi:uncharacterized protein